MGHHDGVDFLVMEYLEGETLAARLRKGPMPLAQALRTAIEIAEALAAAHAQGIVHRDLKPGNVMLTQAGVKLLDFGLARLCGPDGSVPSPATSAVSSGQVAPGLVLGTLQYMAPEQLEGKDVDARADIFAFGAVVYEMVTGRKAFEGNSQLSLISALLSSPHSLAVVTPPALNRVIRTLPAKRIATIAGRTCTTSSCSCSGSRRKKWRLPSSRPPASIDEAPRAGGAPCRGRSPRSWASDGCWCSDAGHRGQSTPALGPQRLSVELGVDGTLPATDAPFVFSPDGSLLAFVARTSGKAEQLHVRRLDELRATSLTGTDGASTPFFSPDCAVAGILRRLEAEEGSGGRRCRGHARGRTSPSWRLVG